MTDRERCRDTVTWRRAVMASTLRTGAKVVCLVLYEHMDWSGAEAGSKCFPTLDTISVRAGMSRRAVIRALDDADTEGFIDRERGGGREVATHYHATLPTPLNSAIRDTVYGYGKRPETVPSVVETVPSVVINSVTDGTQPISTNQNPSLSRIERDIVAAGASESEAREIFEAAKADPRIKTAVGYLRHQLATGDIADTVAELRDRPQPVMPWCGDCEGEASRVIYVDRDTVDPCPRCSREAQNGAAA